MRRNSSLLQERCGDRASGFHSVLEIKADTATVGAGLALDA